MTLRLSVLTRADGSPEVDAPYRAFARFRRRVADGVGLGDINDYEGFDGEKHWPSREVEPLVLLLHHSDCGGELWWHELEGVADRLRAVIRLWPEDDEDRKYGEKVASVCEYAVREWGVVTFQ